MNLRITILSDLMEWKEHIEQYGNSLSLAYVNNEAYELDIAKIPDDFLLPIIVNHIKDDLENNEIDAIQPLDGGLRIDANGSSIEWTCCEDITDFYHWETTLNQSDCEWTNLWIGHPWIFFRIRNQTIEFSNYSDISEASGQKLEVVMKLDYDEFQKQLQTKLIEMSIFKEKIKQVILQSQLTNKELIISQLLREN